MSPPLVRVNTFVHDKPSAKTTLDRISKLFVLSELICGINRIPVLGDIQPIYIALSLVVTISINIIVIYFGSLRLLKGFGLIVQTLKLSQYLICATLGFAFQNKLKMFFLELDDFDKVTGFQKVSIEMMVNVVQLGFTFGLLLLTVIGLHMFAVIDIHSSMIVVVVIQVAELHFYGHLLNLLVPRLRCIYRLMKSSFEQIDVSIVQNELARFEDKKDSLVDMRKLMDFYHRIIRAFDVLNEAIRWQMLIILVTSFITSLSVSFSVTTLYIRGNNYPAIKLLGKMILASFEMIPLFAPCRIVDAVHGEVRCLTEQLSSKLYEKKIGFIVTFRLYPPIFDGPNCQRHNFSQYYLKKADRTVAQALLALMQARDLSFSLLHIFDIDVSFPFKFLGLLVTYLIILLQFEKVIHLDRPA